MRHIVDVGGIFAETAPRIADVVEEIRPEHMTPEAPALVVTLAEHMHRADADLVDASDVPAEVMMARRVRSRERDHVVVAAVDSVQERDVVARMVGKPQAQHARVELDRFRTSVVNIRTCARRRGCVRLIALR